MPREVDNDLLIELCKAGNLLCKFGQQLEDWGEGTQTAVNRAIRYGVSVQALHDVLSRSHPDIAELKTARMHFKKTCRCPKRLRW